MRNTITLLSIALLLVACNSVKRTQKFLARGNYDQAIALAVKKLQKDETGEKSAEHILLLEEAFEKAVADDMRRISFLQGENSPQGAREVYAIYSGLERRQRLLRPLLPINNIYLEREANFKLVDYNEEILTAKEEYITSLYNEAQLLMSRDSKPEFREAYEVFEEINELKPNYKDVAELIEDAHYYGTDFVHVTLHNSTGQIIPQRLERDLLDFSTYDLDDFWTVFHSQAQQNQQYDYGVRYNFREISILPERLTEREFIRKNRIKDGWRYKLDRNGNVMKDSLGNDIKIDVFKNVTAKVFVTEQQKSVIVGGDVTYRDFGSGRDIDTYPLSSEFVFENIFATFEGDERALTVADREAIRARFIPFPSNEQMVYDAGSDIKVRLSEILKQNSFY